MIALAASPLARKIGFYIVIAIILYWIGRQWLNSHDNKVAQETRQEVTEAARIEKEASLKAEREKVAQERALLLERIERLNLDLDKVYRSLDNALATARKAQERNASTVINIPDHELNGAIRAVLRGQQPSGSNGTAPGPTQTP